MVILGNSKNGNIETSKRNYHSFEKGEKVYIPYNDEKNFFTDWIYSGKEYYREK